MIEVLYSTPTLTQGSGMPFTREDHRRKETSLMRSGKRVPRRSQTFQEYHIPQPPLFTLHTIQQLPEEDFVKLPIVSVKERSQAKPTEEKAVTVQRRPALGPPRRSYSVTDRLPLPVPSAGKLLLDLPPELHMAIFDFLDPIDSTCFGLTNKHFYAIHRRMHGTVPLRTRREGPNELEWAWHLAGMVRKSAPSSPVEEKSEEESKKSLSLSQLRVRGQAYCRKCGVTRCQLHKHIQEWMGENMEYCSIREKFGPIAPEGAKSYCYMSKPGDKTRCGRHFVRKSKVVLQ
ncbi:hypothetical protein SMACR_06308 [Sordaria macrospora]|uniref:WGS project CABT00000000 data, contig 2.34 n=2 Tax=Sordaria macrospora TaxID=5147 RepID=F7W6F1_SORMK|nr:uncharacterized protein SMAC_06308 [Sordaria macrospora k-hell]KAA8635206.1 hypothetical protein SMACR_06308 [Sordaria macrospora]KAH7630419.1 hypothetical protein B0T09DRAFT_148296 [Sordaria sp. MPI-SDFR-AT-0083]WPJ67086.1 hypothetical protein SMAC4_06308 [Sordaria macrospora]CCC13090.1 unnamed protein product [Sordaria macrospora k-hell]